MTTITGEGLILNFCGPVRGWGVLTPGIFCCRAPTLLITNCVNTPPGEGRAAANKNLLVKNLQFSYFILVVIVFINIYWAPLGQFLTGIKKFLTCITHANFHPQKSNTPLHPNQTFKILTLTKGLKLGVPSEILLVTQYNQIARTLKRQYSSTQLHHLKQMKRLRAPPH